MSDNLGFELVINAAQGLQTMDQMTKRLEGMDRAMQRVAANPRNRITVIDARQFQRDADQFRRAMERLSDDVVRMNQRIADAEKRLQDVRGRGAAERKRQIEDELKSLRAQQAALQSTRSEFEGRYTDLLAERSQAGEAYDPSAGPGVGRRMANGAGRMLGGAGRFVGGIGRNVMGTASGIAGALAGFSLLGMITQSISKYEQFIDQGGSLAQRGGVNNPMGWMNQIAGIGGANRFNQSESFQLAGGYLDGSGRSIRGGTMGVLADFARRTGLDPSMVGSNMGSLARISGISGSGSEDRQMAKLAGYIGGAVVDKGRVGEVLEAVRGFSQHAQDSMGVTLGTGYMRNLLGFMGSLTRNNYALQGHAGASAAGVLDEGMKSNPMMTALFMNHARGRMRDGKGNPLNPITGTVRQMIMGNMGLFAPASEFTGTSDMRGPLTPGARTLLEELKLVTPKGYKYGGKGLLPSPMEDSMVIGMANLLGLSLEGKQGGETASKLTSMLYKVGKNGEVMGLSDLGQAAVSGSEQDMAKAMGARQRTFKDIAAGTQISQVKIADISIESMDRALGSKLLPLVTQVKSEVAKAALEIVKGNGSLDSIQKATANLSPLTAGLLAMGMGRGDMATTGALFAMFQGGKIADFMKDPQGGLEAIQKNLKERFGGNPGTALAAAMNATTGKDVILGHGSIHDQMDDDPRMAGLFTRYVRAHKGYEKIDPYNVNARKDPKKYDQMFTFADEFAQTYYQGGGHTNKEGGLMQLVAAVTALEKSIRSQGSQQVHVKVEAKPGTQAEVRRRQHGTVRGKGG